MSSDSQSRRHFLKCVGLGATAAMVGMSGCSRISMRPTDLARATSVRRPRRLAEKEKLNIACVGCGGKGTSDIEGVSGENIVALCDVDANRAAEGWAKHPKAPKYWDYRRMLREMDDKIDAVVVATPDHVHFPAAMMAISMGKHVYVQKPLTHTVWEARQLTLAARRHGVATQMGNQGHANEGTRLLKEWVDAGAIGKVREVHIWTNRPIWPQGIDRPAEEMAVPDPLQWNLWLNGAPYRPYNEAYMPFNWRGWWDFGCGALGDMGCHLMDAAFWALKLDNPKRIEATSSGINKETAPEWSIITYEFGARGDMPPLKLVWYDGGKMPPRPKELDPDREMPKGGQILIGDKGIIMDDSDYCHSPRLIPESAMRAFLPHRPPKTIPRVPESDPYKEWIAACKGGMPAGSNFDHSGPLTEMILLGNVALRAEGPIEWDGENMRVTNDPKADKLIRGNRYRRF
ncbi:MAG: Gfo/Idh/MocA family oxidoreductase [bacterium]|nr:Gfo/Idh/MocA family oxidoreductase [bacterium]